MAIYELEERVFFDGAIAADVAEVEDMSNFDAVETNNHLSSGTHDLSNDVQYDSAENDSLADDQDLSESDNSQLDDEFHMSYEGDTATSDSLDSIFDSLSNTSEIPDLQSEINNLLLVPTTDEIINNISSMINDNTVVVEYSADDSVETIIENLKAELGDNKAVHIGILNSDISEQLTVNSEKLDVDELVDSLKEFQTVDGTVDIIDFELGSDEVDMDSTLTEFFDTDSSQFNSFFGDVFPHASTNTSTLQPINSSTDIYFIDSAVEDADVLIEEISSENPDAVIIELAEGEGIDAMTDIVEEYSDIDSVHILSQGNYAQILLGDDVITSDNISEYKDAFSSWNDNLTQDADILFYGCEIAKEAAGKEVLNQIADWTGADIAASTDITGGADINYELGTANYDAVSESPSSLTPIYSSTEIDFDLEYTIGSIEASIVSAVNYNPHLETYTVTESTDDASGTVEGTLSWAIEQANSTATVDDIINFNLSEGNTVTVSGDLLITDNLAINGNDVTIAFDNADNGFIFDDGNDNSQISITINDLTIVEAGGHLSPESTEEAKLIRNSENLTITNTSIDDIGYVYAHIPTDIENPKVILISSILDDVDDLLAAVNDDVILLEYDPQVTSLTELSAMVKIALNGRKASSIAFANHSSGANEFYLTDSEFISLGSTFSDVGQQEFWGTIGEMVQESGRIDLLACNLASGSDGDMLIAGIQSFAGVSVAASVDATGNPEEGGDWILETDNISSEVYFNSEAVKCYTGLMNNSDIFETGTAIDTIHTNSIALGDVNNDGLLDIVAGNNGVNMLYLQNAEGTFSEGKEVGPEGESTFSIALGDVNNDGLLDIVAGNYQGSKVYLQNANGTFADVIEIGAEDLYTQSIALGDVNNDGLLDIVAGSDSGNKLYLQNANGTFSDGREFASATDETLAIALGDVDNDGYLDIVVGNTGQNKLFLNSGDGTFAEGIEISSEEDNTQSITLGDINNDGKLDVVVGNYRQTNKLYLQNSNGTFAEGIEIGSDTDNTESITLGDVNNDGHLDVVAGDRDQINKLYINDGKGNFESGIEIGSDTDDTQSITLGDINNDGKLDVVVGNFSQESKVYLQKTQNLRTEILPGYDIGSGSDNDNGRSIALGDVDNDGDLDVVVANYEGTNKLYVNSGDGTFELKTEFGSVEDETNSIALGDIDNNGLLDVVVGNGGVNGQRNKLYLGNGDGTFSDGIDIGIDADETFSIALGDIDNDGDLDVVAGNYDQENKLYINDGDGTFSRVENIGGKEDATLSIALGDVNNDGLLDVVAGSSSSPSIYRNKVYLNKGDYTFSDIIGLEGMTSTESIALGDIDNDGDLDIIAGNYNQKNKLYINNGDGTFSEGIDIGIDADKTASIALGDINNDGYLDVVVANYQGINKLYINDGDGTFELKTEFGSVEDYSNSIALGDVNNDGLLDIVIGDGYETTKLYLNDYVYEYQTVDGFTEGNWDDSSATENYTWERRVAGSVYDWVAGAYTPDSTESSITIRSGTVTLNSNVTIDETTVESGAAIIISSGITLTVVDDGTDAVDLAALGNISIAGTLLINSGAMADSDGSFTSTGIVSFDDVDSTVDDGTLKLAAETPTLGTLTASNGTVVYDGGDQTVVAADYYELQLVNALAGIATTKTFADGTTKIGKEILITDSITLTGSSADNVTVQVTTPGEDGTASRVFYIAVLENSVNIENMTIRGGDILALGLDGGGIYVAAGNVILEAVNVSDGKAKIGGGIYNGGILTVNNSTIESNSAGYQGGGIYNLQGAELTINSSSVSNNSAANGGGIYNYSVAGLTINSSTVSNNSAGDMGGGIYNYSGAELTINSSTVSNNSAGEAGGGIASAGTLTVISSTISGNTSARAGGGIFSGGTLTVISSTISGNTSEGLGGCLYYIATGDNAVYILNSIIINNTGRDIYYNNEDATGAVNVYYSWYNQVDGAGTISTKPNAPNQTESYTEGDLGVLQNNGGTTETMSLSTDAPAYEAGCNVYHNETDGYYFEGVDGKYYKLDTYEEVTPTYPLSDKIKTDQRGISISGKPSMGSFALPLYEYRTTSGGDWSSYTIWERREEGSTGSWTALASTDAVPDYKAVSITVRHAVNVTANVTIDETTVFVGAVDGTNYTGSILVKNGITLTVADDGTDAADLTVAGSISEESEAAKLILNTNSTVLYNGGDQTVVAADYYNLTVGNTGIKTIGNGAAINGIGTIDGTAKVLIDPTAIVSGTVTKVYDGTINLPSDPAVACDLSNIFTGYTVTMTYDAALAGKNVGLQAVNLTNLALTGTDSSKFTLDGTSQITASGGSVDVTVREITVTAAADTRVYDGTTDSDGEATITFGTLADGDTVTWSQSFDNKNAGSNKTLTASGTVSDGNGGNNYSITFVKNTTGEITAKALTLAAVTDTKEYDGTVTSDERVTVTGAVTGDTVSVSQEYVSKMVFNLDGSTLQVKSGYTIVDGSGADMSGNYSIAEITATGTITPKALTLNATAADKVYNGNSDATVTGYGLSGFVNDETVTASSASAQFNSKDVLSANTVTISEISLSNGNNGGLASNYSVAESTTAEAKITAKELTLNATAADKVYDGNSDATVTGYGLTGFIESETVNASSISAIFNSKDVLTANTVTISGISLSDGDNGGLASNYSIATTTTTEASITAKELTLNATAADKVYNGNSDATVTGYGLSGFVNDETVTASSASAQFNSKDVLSANTVTISEISLSNGNNGGLASNYSVAESTTAEAKITAKELTLNATAADKVYNGNSDATVTGYGLTGFIESETVNTSSISAIFNSKDVLTANTVTISGISLSDGDNGGLASNYSIATTTTTEASITAKELTLNATAADKVYNGNSDATVTGYGLSGFVNDETVTASSASAQFNSKDVLSANTVTISEISLSNGNNGGLASNYSVAESTTAEAKITAKELTLNATAADKVYDGNSDATVTGYGLTGFIESETVNASSISAIFNSKDVLTANTVTISGISLSDGDNGGLASNYSIATTTTTEASITAKELTLNATAADKVYNGNSDATVTGYGLSGFVNDETVTASSASAQFNSKDVLSANTVTISEISLSNGNNGGLASNYSVAESTTAEAKITAKELTLNATAADKVYNGNSDATVTGYGLTGFIESETVNTSSISAIFNSKDVLSANTVTISEISLSNGNNGGLASNYSVAESTTAEAKITAKELTLNATASDKVYDGTTNATVTGYELSGFVNNETVTASSASAQFNSKDVLSANTVTISGIFLSDGDNGGLASNYSVAESTTAEANITAKELTFSATGSNKVYDGTSDATITSDSLDGFVGSETVIVSGYDAAFNSKDVFTANTITVSGIILGDGTDGGLASNYFVSNTDFSANITPREGVLTADNIVKQYGDVLSNGAGYTDFTATGFVSGENVGSVYVSYGMGAEGDAAAGVYSGSVMLSNAVGGLFNISNYLITYNSGNITVTGSPSPSPTPDPTPTPQPDVNNGEMINDTTEMQTDTSWRNSIDNGPGDSIDSSEGFGPNGVEGVGLIMKPMITFDLTVGGGLGDGEYSVGTGIDSAFMLDGEYGIKRPDSGSMIDGEYGVDSANEEFELALDEDDEFGAVDLTFNFDGSDDAINFEGMAVMTEKHPIFKTELDLLLEKI